jgi:hypothetical protein
LQQSRQKCKNTTRRGTPLFGRKPPAPPAAPSNLCPKNGAAQSILKVTSTDPPTKSVASINPSLFQNAPPSSTLQKDPSSSKLNPPSFIYASKSCVRVYSGRTLHFLVFSTMSQNAACDPNSGATSATTTAEDSATTKSTSNSDSRDVYPLHCHPQYIYFRMLSEFDLDFDCFAYKINKVRRKIELQGRQNVRQNPELRQQWPQ